MANPIQTKIINEIKRLIPLMTIANGYSRDYTGTIDEDTPANIQFPAIWLIYPADEPLDIDSNVINRYSVNLPFMFRVWIDTAADLDEQLADIVGDFGRMFAKNLPSLQTEGLIKSDYAGESSEYLLIAGHPAEILISFILNYRWQMENPYST